jgi:hypothetical protein
LLPYWMTIGSTQLSCSACDGWQAGNTAGCPTAMPSRHTTHCTASPRTDPTRACTWWSDHCTSPTSLHASSVAKAAAEGHKLRISSCRRAVRCNSGPVSARMDARVMPACVVHGNTQNFPVPYPILLTGDAIWCQTEHGAKVHSSRIKDKGHVEPGERGNVPCRTLSWDGADASRKPNAHVELKPGPRDLRGRRRRWRRWWRRRWWWRRWW